MLKQVLTEDEYLALPENLQEDYQEHDNDDGKVFRLQVEGMVGEDDVEGLKSALEKERENAKDAKAKAKEFEEKAEKFNSQIAELEAAKDAEITRLSEKLNAKENQTKAQQQKIREQMGNVLRDKAAIQAINSHHGNLKFLLPELQKELVAIIDEDGTARIEAMNAKDDDGKPCTADALVAKMRKDPAYGSVFRGSGSSGGGMPPGSGSRLPTTTTQRRGDMTPRQKIDLIREKGDEYFQSLPY